MSLVSMTTAKNAQHQCHQLQNDDTNDETMAVRQLGQLLSDVMRVSGKASHVNEWEELAAL